jgi:hypothetical protein
VWWQGSAHRDDERKITMPNEEMTAIRAALAVALGNSFAPAFLEKARDATLLDLPPSAADPFNGIMSDALAISRRNKVAMDAVMADAAARQKARSEAQASEGARE